MALEIILMRKGKWLAPADGVSEQHIAAMKHDEVVTATIRRQRNPRHHRLFFALLNIVFQNQTRYPTLEHLLDAIKLAIGHYDTMTIGNREIVKLRSISFSKMDQATFGQFFDRVVELVITRILPHTTREDLEAQVYEMIGESPPARIGNA